MGANSLPKIVTQRCRDYARVQHANHSAIEPHIKSLREGI